MNWQPSADLPMLRARAALLDSIREFFAARHVLAVETPLLCSAGVTDPAIEPLIVERGSSLHSPHYLQTSPEYAMKRLLAAGSGPIYQLTKAFRDGEAGVRHNPEFTLLEWYRPDHDYHQLMREVAELVCSCLGEKPVQYITYRDLFLAELGLDPLTASLADLRLRAQQELDLGSLDGDKDLWLDLLMSHLIEPRLAARGLCFVYDYPALPGCSVEHRGKRWTAVGAAFLSFMWTGLELANGYSELTDPAEQRRRFQADNTRRRDTWPRRAAYG